MHAEVVYKLHPRADSDPQTSAAKKKTDTRTKHQKVEKSEIDMKQGSRKDHKDILHLGLKRTAKW